MNQIYTKFLTQVFTEASKIATASFGRVTGTTKPEDNNQVLTATDLEIGRLIVGQIQAAFPGHNIIDEEAGVIDNHSNYTWVVDPIDGTSNFAAGVETYGIMIGLLENDIPIAGGIALPSFGKIITAEKGQGAYLAGTRVSVSKNPTLLSSLVAYGINGHQEDPTITRTEAGLLGEIVLAIRNLRSSNSAYDAVMVAEGRYGATLNRTSKIWDNVAPQIIIEEAGGLYTDFNGQPINYADALTRTDENLTWCGGTPELHKQLQTIIHAHS